MKKQLPAWCYPVMIAALCLLTRLPQLLSPNLLLDGDECVLATMAKYLYHGKDFSMFFWGQNYGFSFVESAAIVPFYFVFGINAIAVKLAMLTLWTIGVIFFYKTMLEVSNKGQTISLLLTLLLIASPAWAVWSMKARGGYLTAFLLGNIVTYLLFNVRHFKRNGSYFLIAILIHFIYQSQPFFLSLVLPLTAYRLFQEKSVTKTLLLLLPLVFLLVIFHYYKATIPDGYQPVNFPPNTRALLTERINRIPEYFYGSLHGNYYFSGYQSPNFFCAFYAILSSILIYGLALLGLGFSIFKRKGNGLFILSVSSLVLCAAYSVWPRDMEGRYLLPLTANALFALQLVLNKTHLNKVTVWSMSTIAATGIVAVVTFWQFQFMPYNKKDLTNFISYLESKGVYYTFSTRTMLPWQLSFYSQEKVYSRSSYVTGRFAPHQNAVNDAYNRGAKTAVIGFKEDAEHFNFSNEYPSDVLFICRNLPDEKIRLLFLFP